MLLNVIITYFGRIYFPINFKPETVSFFENWWVYWWVLTAGQAVVAALTFLMFFGVVFIFNGLKEILQSLFSKKILINIEKFEVFGLSIFKIKRNLLIKELKFILHNEFLLNEDEVEIKSEDIRYIVYIKFNILGEGLFTISDTVDFDYVVHFHKSLYKFEVFKKRKELTKFIREKLNERKELTIRQKVKRLYNNV